MGLSIMLAGACAAAMAIFTGLGMITAVLMLSILVVFGVARAFLGPASSSLVVFTGSQQGLRQRRNVELFRLAGRDDRRASGGRVAAGAGRTALHQLAGGSRPAADRGDLRRPRAGDRLYDRLHLHDPWRRAGLCDPETTAIAAARTPNPVEHARRLPLHLEAEDHSRRDLAGPVRRADGRRHRAVADLCRGHPQAGTGRARLAAGGAWHWRDRHGGGDRGVPDQGSCRPDHVRLCGAVRRSSRWCSACRRSPGCRSLR